MNFFYRAETAVDEYEALEIFNRHVQVTIVVYNTLFTPIMGSGSMWGSPRVRPEGPRGPLNLDLFWPLMVNYGPMIKCTCLLLY